nr:MAG: glycoprotein [Mononegavirales sp.]
MSNPKTVTTSLLLLLSLFHLATAIQSSDPIEDQTYSLTGFDCTKPLHHRYTPAIDPLPCPTRIGTHNSPTNTSGTLLFDNAAVKLQAAICEITLTTRHMYCSFYRWSDVRTDIEQVLAPKAEFFPLQACSDLISSRRSTFRGKTIELGLDSTTSVRMDNHVAPDGWCTPYSSAYKEITATVSVKPITLRLAFDSATDDVLLRTVTNMPVHQTSGSSGVLSNLWPIVWEEADLPQSRFSVLYQGSASETFTQKNESMIIISSRATALQLVQPITAHNLQMFSTSVPSLFWTYQLLGPPNGSYAYQHLDLMDLALTSDGFMKVSIAEAFRRSQLSTLTGICELREEVLQNLRMHLSSPPYSHSGMILPDRNIKLMMAGESIVSTPCTRRSVFINKTAKCYSKIPVSIVGMSQRLFLTPQSREIVDFASEIPCSDAYLPVLDINGTLVRFSPDLEYMSQDPYILSKDYSPSEFHVDLRAHLYPESVLASLSKPEPYTTIEEKARLTLLKGVAQGYGQTHYSGQEGNDSMHPLTPVGISVGSTIGLLLIVAATVGIVWVCRKKGGCGSPNPSVNLTISQNVQELGVLQEGQNRMARETLLPQPDWRLDP